MGGENRRDLGAPEGPSLRIEAPSPYPPQPGWKVGLAVLSLLLSSLLWLNALIGSFKEPTVGNALQLRQLELAALAAPALPDSLRAGLSGRDARRDLRKELRRQVEESPTPAAAELQLELALLELQLGDPATAASQLEVLAGQARPDQRPLIAALRQGQRHDAADLTALEQAWPLSSLRRQLLCEQLAAQPQACNDPALQRQALWRLLGTTALPALLVLVGLGLLARQGWRRWRRGLGAPAPLQGPPLDLVDVTLLIAGGFVLLGEVVTPLVAAPVVSALATRLSSVAAVQQGLMVLGLYLSLMAGPLLILRLLLPPGLPPELGLQWRWRPLTGSLGWAVSRVLMVLPVVALVGWLVDHLVGDGGGSNPLLELVLTTREPVALACFAFTALILAPLFEETLFRGVLLPVLAQRWGSGWGLLVSALSFAVAHLSLAELPALLALGLGLGWLRLRSGRLGCCVLMHGLWNGFTFLNLLLLAG